MKKLILFFAFLPTIVQAQSETFLSTKDVSLGYHDGYNTENTNYGSAKQLAGFVVQGTASSGGVNSNRGLVYFDLSSIAPGTQIQSAKISLFAFDGYTSNLPQSNGHYGNNSCYLRRVTQNWTENTTTWNTQPTTTIVDQAILPQSTSAHQDYLDIDVTAIVQFMIDNPNQNFGFLLGLLEEELGNNLSFHSRETTTPSKIPSLTVDYRTSSISELISLNFNLFPNPASNSITIESEEKIDEISIYNLDGKLISTQPFIGNSLDVSKLPAGVYFIEALSEDGNIGRAKFIKKD